MALEAARGGRRGTRPGWRARRGLEGIGPRGAAWDPGGVTERRGGLCPQVPELEKATVRIQRPERVMAIIRAIKEQGMNKLQVLALFGFGGGGAGPAGSGRWMHRPRVPSCSSAAPPPLPQPPPRPWPGCSQPMCKDLPRVLQMEREKPQTRAGDWAAFPVKAHAGGSPWMGLFLP